MCLFWSPDAPSRARATENSNLYTDNKESAVRFWLGSASSTVPENQFRSGEQSMTSVKKRPHLRAFWSTALRTLLYEI